MSKNIDFATIHLWPGEPSLALSNALAALCIKLRSVVCTGPMQADQHSQVTCACATDNWKDMDSNFINNWLTSHSQVASQLGKPLILEEVCLCRFSPDHITE